MGFKNLRKIFNRKKREFFVRRTLKKRFFLEEAFLREFLREYKNYGDRKKVRKVFEDVLNSFYLFSERQKKVLLRKILNKTIVLPERIAVRVLGSFKGGTSRPSGIIVLNERVFGSPFFEETLSHEVIHAVNYFLKLKDSEAKSAIVSFYAFFSSPGFSEHALLERKEKIKNTFFKRITGGQDRAYKRQSLRGAYAAIFAVLLKKRVGEMAAKTFLHKFLVSKKFMGFEAIEELYERIMKKEIKKRDKRR